MLDRLGARARVLTCPFQHRWCPPPPRDTGSSQVMSHPVLRQGGTHTLPPCLPPYRARSFPSAVIFDMRAVCTLVREGTGSHRRARETLCDSGCDLCRAMLKVERVVYDGVKNRRGDPALLRVLDAGAAGGQKRRRCLY